MSSFERVLAKLLHFVGFLAAAASGIYMLLYLSRWEWNRAMIAGLFFVAAEVALATAAVLRRLHRFERRLDEIGTFPTSRSSGPSASPHPFAWLNDVEGHGVFIPVLLGLGVVLSAVAWVVERLASASWSLGGDAAAERRLGRLAAPTDDLVAEAGRGGGRETVRLHPLRAIASETAPHPVTWVATSLFVIASVAIVVVLARFTMYVPGPVPTDGRTSYELLVRTRSGEPDASIVDTLWRTCKVHTPGRTATWDSLGEGRYRLTVEPGLARNDDLRFSGCLADLRFDFVVTDVLSRDGVVALAPPGTAQPPS